MTTQSAVSKKFSLKVSNKTHPRHNQYMGVRTLEHSLSQMKWIQENTGKLSEDEELSLLAWEWFDKDTCQSFQEGVLKGDIVGVGWNSFLVVDVSTPDDLVDSTSPSLLVKSLQEHFQEGKPYDDVVADTKSGWLTAGVISSAKRVGYCEILYRDGKPYGQPPEEDYEAEVVEIDDGHGNKIPALKMKKKVASSADAAAAAESVPASAEVP